MVVFSLDHLRIVKYNLSEVNAKTPDNRLQTGPDRERTQESGRMATEEVILCSAGSGSPLTSLS